MELHLAPEQKKTLCRLCNCLIKLLPVIHSSFWPTASLLVRMTEFISSVSIIPRRALNCLKQPFKLSVGYVPSLEKHIWPSLSTFIGHFRTTTELKRNLLLPVARCQTNREFRFCLATSIAARVTGRNHWRK